jgi:branched-chain amino acid transport system permease protein
MDQATLGLILYALGLANLAAIYAVMALGLNLNWGVTGLFNAGVAGFFAVGAYTSVILTAPDSPHFLGGFDLPLPVGMVAAMLLSGVIALAIGASTIRLRSDYLAIGTLGIAEIIRLLLKNEEWLTNGVRGITTIPRPFVAETALVSELSYLAMTLLILLVLYVLLEAALNSPWGRMMRAIRDSETTAAAAGKNVDARRLEAFVLGSMLMGLGGALFAHYLRYIGPEATEPITTTFLVWVMLIAGGSGNNRGAILGAFVVWIIWSATELVTRQLPPDWAVRAGYLRIFLIGLLLQIVLQRFRRGILPERNPAERGATGPQDRTL